MKSLACLGVAGLALAGWLATAGYGAEKVEPPNTAPWYVSASAAMMKYEGDQAIEDNEFAMVFRLGYDQTDWWSWEGALTVAPYLPENLRYDIPTHQWVSRLEETAGPGVHSTWATGLALDGLFHFTRWERFDPYLALGGCLMYYANPINDSGQVDPSVRGGGGVMFHFNDEWAGRVDARLYLAGTGETECNGIFDAGVVWYWGAGVKPSISAVGGTLDSDGDGLSDKDETEVYHTDPYKPDTDGDGLRDGEEVLKYHTDPLNKDTDYDGLSDGEEVLKYGTNPLERDTDHGGVADGHEVIEDGTDPLNGADDLMLIELKINFDWDKTTITSQYIPKLDIVGKVLSRNPTATARIEGHADRNRNSEAEYNKRLSLRRASSVVSYLAQQVGIDEKRLTAAGYGFDRPKAQNDPKTGNSENRRVEVYIRGVDKDKEMKLTGEAMTAPEPPAPEAKGPAAKAPDTK